MIKHRHYGERTLNFGLTETTSKLLYSVLFFLKSDAYLGRAEANRFGGVGVFSTGSTTMNNGDRHRESTIKLGADNAHDEWENLFFKWVWSALLDID